MKLNHNMWIGRPEWMGPEWIEREKCVTKWLIESFPSSRPTGRLFQTEMPVSTITGEKFDRMAVSCTTKLAEGNTFRRFELILASGEQFLDLEYAVTVKPGQAPLVFEECIHGGTFPTNSESISHFGIDPNAYADGKYVAHLQALLMTIDCMIGKTGQLIPKTHQLFNRLPPCDEIVFIERK